MTQPFHDWDPWDFLQEINTKCDHILAMHRDLLARQTNLDAMFHEMAVHIVHLESQIEDLEKRK